MTNKDHNIKKKIKILLILPEDLKGNRWGGVSTYTTILAKHLVKRGHQVNVLMPGDKNESYIQENCKIYRLKTLKEAENNLALKLIHRIFEKLLPDFVGRLYWSLNVYYFVKW